MKERRQYLLEKFLHDQCSREELIELLTYLENGKEREYNSLLHQVWEELQSYAPLGQSTIAQITNNVSAQINQKNSSRNRSLLLLPHFLVAATFTALIMILGGVYFFSNQSTSTITHQTAYGETMEIVLPDSSVVTLNGNSQISYVPSWEPSATRKVWLEGEAFFEVRKKDEANQQNEAAEGLKFVVFTSNFNVEVLGTSFNVKDRGDRASVVLNSGKVRLQKKTKSNDIEMKPGDRVAVSSESDGLVTKAVDPELYSSWTKNKLVFERTPLPEIARLLEDNYGLDVTFKYEELKDRIFTATIPTIQVDVLLTILEESMKGVKITKEGNRIIIE